MSATTSKEIEEILDDIVNNFENIQIVPVGGRENNYGHINMNKDPGRALVERVTNAIDAVLEYQHNLHNGVPECKSPKEAATAWLNIPPEGLHKMSTTERQAVAKNILIKVERGDDKYLRTVSVRDYGVGISPEQMPSTILSLGESNKLQKLYLAGVYGQGGSSTFAFSKYTLIASRLNGDPSAPVAYTIVYYQNLPADRYKLGNYVYITSNDRLFIANPKIEDFPGGTLVKHFGYDLSDYGGPFGVKSVYGLLQRILFSPIMPFFLRYEYYDRQERYNRVIKGSRNALNGAVDENERGPDLTHNVPMYYVTIKGYGRIGIEYWVLEKKEKDKTPSASFVDNKHPIIITHNGQNHAELSSLLIKKECNLPYIANRLIVHVDCNYLTPEAKRQLFVSSREEVKKSKIADRIKEEIVKSLISDETLVQINSSEKDRILSERITKDEKDIKKEVLSLLRAYGKSEALEIGNENPGDGGNVTTNLGPKTKQLKFIELKEVPTYVHLLGDLIKFYPGQRRYLRVETDAMPDYEDKIAIEIEKDIFEIAGKTSLQAGRMRFIIDAKEDAAIGQQGKIRVSLITENGERLEDDLSYEIVEKPTQKKGRKKVGTPDIQVVPIKGPEDPQWDDLGWPKNTETVAYSYIKDENGYTIYYSEIFPPYKEKLKKFEREKASLAKIFKRRYEIWLSVHSILFDEDKKDYDELEEKRSLEEMKRVAKLATIFAQKEIKEMKKDELDF